MFMEEWLLVVIVLIFNSSTVQVRCINSSYNIYEGGKGYHPKRRELLEYNNNMIHDRR